MSFIKFLVLFVLIFLSGLLESTSSAQSRTVASEFAVDRRGTGVGDTGFVSYYELAANGNNVIRFRASDAMASDTVYTYPDAFPASAGSLTSDAAGLLSWSVGAGSFPCGADTQIFFNDNGNCGASSSYVVAKTGNAVLSLTSENAVPASAVRGMSHGASPTGLLMQGFASGGTIASSTATPANGALLDMTGFGHDGTSFTGQGLIRTDTPALWTGSSKPTQHSFFTTDVGSTILTIQWRIQPNGDFDPILAGRDIASVATPVDVGSFNTVNADVVVGTSATGGFFFTDTADASDTKLNTVNGGGGGGNTRGGQITVYGNEHGVAPGDVLLAPGNVTGGSVDIVSAAGTFQARFIDRNFIIGNSSDTFPTSCLNCMMFGTAAAPTANPVTGVAAFNDAGWGYRSSTTGEGQGVTNRVHNRFEEQGAIGTAYTFTTVGAKVAFGTTSPEVTLSTAGTWLLIARLTIEYSAATTTGQAVAVRMRNVTDSIDIANTTISHRLGTHTVITDSVFSNSWTGIYTIALASRNIQIFGNLSGAIGAGTIIAVAGEMRAVRLY